MSVNADQIKRPSGTFAPVAAHGPLEHLWGRSGAAETATTAAADAPADGVWIVHGSFPMSPAGTFPRTMTVVRHSGGRLAIINSMRLDDAGEAALRALGTVDAVVRLGSFHGVDDDYYVRTFGATAYVIPGSPLPPGAAEPVWMATTAGEDGSPPPALPIPGASLFIFKVAKAEGALYLPDFGPAAAASGGGNGDGGDGHGTLILCDSLINMGPRPPHLSWLMATIFRVMGFTGLRPAPIWYKGVKQLGDVDDAYMVAEYERLLSECPTEAAIFVHGDVIPSGAREHIDKVVRALVPAS